MKLIPKLIHVDISKFSHFYIYILQKEMFPNLTAREIGDKLKAINNGIKTEEELIQGGGRCILLCDKVCQGFAAGRWFSPGSPVSSTNITDRHNTTEILLKVAINTITLTLTSNTYRQY
jgi:hypothetical protein